MRRFIARHEPLFYIGLLLIVLRLPNLFEPYWYADESIYLTVGLALRRGLALYSGIVDHKPPLIYLLAMLAGNLLWFKVILMVAALIAFSLFYVLCRRWFTTTLTLSLPLILFCLLTTTPILEGNIVNGELLMLPFVLGGVVLVWGAAAGSRHTRLFAAAAGALFGCAFLVKVTAVFDLLAVLVVAAAFAPRAWRRLPIFVLPGFLFPILVSGLFFFINGHLPDYVRMAYLYNGFYVESGPFLPRWPLYVTLPLRVAALTAYVGLVWRFRRRFRLPVIYALVWFGLAMFAVWLPLRPYAHYLLQLVAPAALLVGFLATEGRFSRAFSLSVLGVMLILAYVFHFRPYSAPGYYAGFVRYLGRRLTYTQYANTFDPRTGSLYYLASWLHDHTAPEDRLFVWGDAPQIYALSRRLPAGRFTTAYHIISFAVTGETAAALHTALPLYIVDLHEYPPATFPAFTALLSASYRPVRDFGTATLYRRTAP